MTSASASATVTAKVTQSPTPAIAALTFSNPTLSQTNLVSGQCGEHHTDITETLSGSGSIATLYIFTAFQHDVNHFTTFDGGTPMVKQFEGTYKVTLDISKLKNATTYDTGSLLVQFIAVDNNQNILGRSNVYLVADVNACH